MVARGRAHRVGELQVEDRAPVLGGGVGRARRGSECVKAVRAWRAEAELEQWSELDEASRAQREREREGEAGGAREEIASCGPAEAEWFDTRSLLAGGEARAAAACRAPCWPPRPPSLSAPTSRSLRSFGSYTVQHLPDHPSTGLLVRPCPPRAAPVAPLASSDPLPLPRRVARLAPTAPPRARS